MRFHRPHQFLIQKLALLLLMAAPLSAAGGDWPQWRGPYLNGSTDETGLPSRWVPQTGARWAAALPGEAGSTPVVSGDRIFLTATDKQDKKKLHAICIRRSDGKELWRRTIPGEGRIAFYNRDASPSPIADGKRVYFLFGHGAFFATDYDGRILWEQNLERKYGPLAVTFIYSASPLLYRDRLYLSMVRDDTTTYSEFHKPATDRLDPLLLCVDPTTGDEIWKAVRPADDYSVENKDSYCTPIPWESAPGQTSIVTVGANFLTGHDWQSGKELWRMRYGRPGGYRQRIVPTPVVAAGLLICNKPRNGAIYAVKPGLSGEVTSSTAVAWEVTDSTTDTPSSLVYRDRLYYVSEKKKRITCLEPRTGRTVWSGALGGTALFFPSPTGADGKIYCVNLSGEVVVLESGDKYRIVGRMAMRGNPTYSTIVAAHGELFIRTAEKLYCIPGEAKRTK